MVAKMVERGQVDFQPGWIDAEKQHVIEAACCKVASERLRPIKDALPQGISYGEIRLNTAKLKSQQGSQS